MPVEESRIYFYRDADQRPELQAAVAVDEEAAGTLQADRFLFVGRDPGKHQFSTGSGPDQHIDLKLEAGHSRYVRLDAKFGLGGDYFVPVEVSELDGAQQILQRRYDGPPLPRIHHVHMVGEPAY